MVLNKIEVKVILDFDGVLFDSLEEVYTLCQRVSIISNKYRKDVSYQEFLNFRKFLTDAWQFNRLYENENYDVKELSKAKKTKFDQEFAEAFFNERKQQGHNCEKFKPYNFFFMVKPLLEKYPDNFLILSTRTTESIRAVLNYYRIQNIEIYGQEFIKKYGGKFDSAKYLNLLDDKYKCLLIDDMADHLLPFHGKISSIVHANWGYGLTEKNSKSAEETYQEILNILGEA